MLKKGYKSLQKNQDKRARNSLVSLTVFIGEKGCDMLWHYSEKQKQKQQKMREQQKQTPKTPKKGLRQHRQNSRSGIDSDIDSDTARTERMNAPVLCTTLLILTGCTATTEPMPLLPEPARPPSFDAGEYEDARLIHHVLLSDQILRQTSTECMRLYPSVMPYAYEVRRQWWQRNGFWVQQADRALSKTIQASIERRSERASVTAPGNQNAITSETIHHPIKSGASAYQTPVPVESGLQISLDIHQQAEQYRDRYLSQNPGQSGCQQFLKYYHSADSDFESQQNGQQITQRLNHLSADYYPQWSNETGPLHQSYDRSLRIAEKLARQTLCRSAHTTAVILQWPREVYNIDCGEQRQYLMRCIWSECSLLP